MRESATTSGTEAWCRTTSPAVSVSCGWEGQACAETGQTTAIWGKSQLLQGTAQRGASRKARGGSHPRSGGGGERWESYVPSNEPRLISSLSCSLLSGHKASW